MGGGHKTTEQTEVLSESDDVYLSYMVASIVLASL
jgi:hypothetical protein